MPESLIRARLTEKRDQITDTERFQGNQVINRENFEEYPHDVSNVTPQKNPQKKSKSSYQTNNICSNILNEEMPIPKSDTEKKAYEDARKFVSKKTSKELSNYISTLIEGDIPKKFKKPHLENIAIKLKYKDELNFEMGIKEGSGMRRKIEGRGLSNPDKVELNNGKFILDMQKLRRNILSVTYQSCRASIQSLKRENISNDVKNIITDIVQDKYNANLFNKMKPDDQRIVSTFVRTMKIEKIDMREFDEAYQKNYEILLGQVNSGQNNPIVKRELKEYILRAISEGLIPKSQGYNKLFELSL
jgi:hypothetical protein